MSNGYYVSIQFKGTAWTTTGPTRYQTKEEAQKAARRDRAQLKKKGEEVRVFVRPAYPGE